VAKGVRGSHPVLVSLIGPRAGLALHGSDPFEPDRIVP
jgi:hypothetical protein